MLRKAIHPFLFALYPIVFLFSHNIELVTISSSLRALFIVLGSTSILLILLSCFLRNLEKAALILSLFLILFFSYGHIANFLIPILKKHRYLIFLNAIIFGIISFIIIKSRFNLRNFTKFLNFTGVVLLGLSFFNIGLYAVRARRVTLETPPKFEELESKKIAPANLPDIYYILVDAYARADILKKVYQYDNTPFLEFLTTRGFYIAERSYSNYPKTFLSLASLLNTEYLDSLSKDIPRTTPEYLFLRKAIENNKVFSFLKQHGYTTVSLPIFIEGHQPKADIILRSSVGGLLNEFEEILLNTTPLSSLLYRFLKCKLGGVYRRRTLYILEKLKHLSSIRSPKFVFAHLLCPHPPFVFKKDGGEVFIPSSVFDDRKRKILPEERSKLKELFITSYREQVIFLTKKLQETIDGILNNSPKPPVIILQADHGCLPPNGCLPPITKRKLSSRSYLSRLKKYCAILSAYYFPQGKGNKFLYPTLSPVNTFRIIFNTYFGVDDKLLPDKIYGGGFRLLLDNKSKTQIIEIPQGPKETSSY
jgi:hypothetical protein